MSNPTAELFSVPFTEVYAGGGSPIVGLTRTTLLTAVALPFVDTVEET